MKRENEVRRRVVRALGIPDQSRSGRVSTSVIAGVVATAFLAGIGLSSGLGQESSFTMLPVAGVALGQQPLGKSSLPVPRPLDVVAPSDGSGKLFLTPPVGLDPRVLMPPGDVRSPAPIGQNDPLGRPWQPKTTPETRKEFDRFVEGTVEPQETLDLVVGIPKLLLFRDPPIRVQLADDKNGIAQYEVVTPRELSLLGRRAGKTVLNLWFNDPKTNRERILSYLVRVHPDHEAAILERGNQDYARALIQQDRLKFFQELEHAVRCAFPNSMIKLKLVGNHLLVCGQAWDAAEATKILQVVGGRRLGNNQGNNGNTNLGQGATIITERGLAGNRSTVMPLPQNGGDANANAPGFDGGMLKLPGRGPAVGDADGPAVDAEPSFVTAPGGQVQIVNLVRIPGEQQVMLKVVVAEVNRTAARNIGLNFSVTNNQGLNVFSNLTSGLLGATTNLPMRLDNGQVFLALNALKTMNMARSLAEPNLVTLNGRAANFRAGGQFPVPVVTGFTASGLQGVDFVPFGVQLSFVPTITDKDRMRLQVAATVSTRDTATGANVNGTDVPGLNDRTFNTTVELREGQTLAVAGLIQNNLGADTARLPFLGNVPGIGQLTGTNSTSHGEQELVVLVTPVLVHPLGPDERPTLPGAEIFEPSDVEFFLLGRVESRRPYDYRAPVMNDAHRMINYRRCEQIFLLGPTGYSDGRP